MESAPFKAFAASLRLDYKCPSAHVLQNRLTQSVYEEVEEAIKLEIAKSEMVTLAYDSWEDHKKCPSLAFTAVLPSKAVFLVDFVPVLAPQTAAFLAVQLKRVVEKVQSFGPRVQVCPHHHTRCNWGLFLSGPTLLLSLTGYSLHCRQRREHTEGHRSGRGGWASPFGVEVPGTQPEPAASRQEHPFQAAVRPVHGDRRVFQSQASRQVLCLFPALHSSLSHRSSPNPR